MMSIGDLAKYRSFFTRLFRPNHVRSHTSPFSKETAADDIESIEKEMDEEQKRLEEEKIQKLRNKSGLHPHHFNIQHGQKPYEENLYEHQETLGYKRKMFGRYGVSSQVDARVLWPCSEELEAKKTYESIAYPHTIFELIERVKKQKEEEEEAITKRQIEIMNKVKTREEKINAFTNKVRNKVLQAYAMKEKKERLITEIRAKIGFDIDVKHARFQEEVKKVEEEARRQAKQKKKEAKEKKKLEIQKKLSEEFEEQVAAK